MSSAGYRVSPGWDGALGDPRSYGYSYSNTNGSLSSMTLPGDGAYSYSYDNLRRLSSRSLSVGNSLFLTREYGYLAGTGTNGTTTLVSSLQNKRANGTVIDGWTYTYDAAGQITSISDGTDIWSYTYDKQGQLLTETLGTGENARTWTYSYDSGGNLRSVTTPDTLGPILPPGPWPTLNPLGEGGSGGEGSDRSGQEIHITNTYSYGNAQWPDLLTAYNGDPISYDAIGNPTEWYDGAEMTWEKGRQLASISAVYGVHGELSFWYNAEGLRLGKTVDDGESFVEHCYTWQGKTLIAEACGDTELEFFYDENGAPYALLVRDLSTATPTEAWYYYVTNLQGDVVMLLDASGSTVAEYSYNAWGKVLEATGTMASVNPIRYRGYYFDVESGLYYLQSRYYDPVVGRFINADGYSSTGQGVLGCNMFAYCLNNPANRIDETGHDAGTLIGGWGSSMWWLTLVDGPLPIGDIIYYGGCIILGAVDVAGLYYLSSSAPTIYYEETVQPEPGATPDFIHEAKKSIPSRKVNQARLMMNIASTAASPPPPGNNGRGTRVTSKTLYEQDGVRIDVENPGNRPGQIHLQIDGKPQTYYYNIRSQNFRIGASNGPLAPRSIQNYLDDYEVIRAICKGLKYIGYFD